MLTFSTLNIIPCILVIEDAPSSLCVEETRNLHFAHMHFLGSWQHPDLSKGSKVQDIELKSSDFTPELGSDAGLGNYWWECASQNPNYGQ